MPTPGNTRKCVALKDYVISFTGMSLDEAPKVEEGNYYNLPIDVVSYGVARGILKRVHSAPPPPPMQPYSISQKGRKRKSQREATRKRKEEEEAKKKEEEEVENPKTDGEPDVPTDNRG